MNYFKNVRFNRILYNYLKYNNTTEFIKTFNNRPSYFDINKQDILKNTLLHYSIKYNNKVIFNELIKHNVDIDKQNRNGETPLLYAYKNNKNPLMITTLKLKGANLFKIDRDGLCSYEFQDNVDIKILLIIMKIIQINHFRSSNINYILLYILLLGILYKMK